MIRIYLLMTLIMASHSNARGEGQSGLRDWTVQDSVSLRYLIRSWTYPAALVGGGNDDTIVWAPDGEHFFYGVRYSDLTSDTVSYEIRVFSVRAILHLIDAGSTDLPKPVATAKIRYRGSDDTLAGIRSPKWLDNDTITFLGQESESFFRRFDVYQLDILSGQTLRLTSVGTACMGPPAQESEFAPTVTGYTFFNEKLIYLSNIVSPRLSRLSPYPMVQMGEWTIQDTLKTLPTKIDEVLHVIGRDSVDISIGNVKGVDLDSVSVSPDGKYAYLFALPEDFEVPKSWQEYARAGAHQNGVPMLVDLATGSARPILSGPPVDWIVTDENPLAAMDSCRGLWTAAGNRLVLTNATLPPGASDQQDWRDTSYVVALHPPSIEYEVLEPRINKASGTWVDRVDWLIPGKRLVVGHRIIPQNWKNWREAGFAASTAYTLRDNHWEKEELNLPREIDQPSGRILPRLLRVSVEESENEPAVVWASSSTGKLRVSEADPAIDSLWRAPAQNVEWQEPDGTVGRGILMLPRNKTTQPPPLVIQWNAQFGVFLPDGGSKSAYAAQPLVAQGFAVLQVDSQLLNRVQGRAETALEMPLAVARIDAAVAELTNRGLIDPNRVGMIGFSRTGFYTSYIVTHPGKTRVLAYTVNDSVTYGFGGYLHMYVPNWGNTRSALENEKTIGGSFWRNKERWLGFSPVFVADQSQSAGLFLYHTRAEPMKMIGDEFYEIVGSLTATKRPVEFRYILAGAHQLTLPRQREASLTSNVDWMNFWLQDKEDPAPGKHKQYERWEKMKADWQHQQQWESAGHPAGSIPDKDFKETRKGDRLLMEEADAKSRQ